MNIGWKLFGGSRVGKMWHFPNSFMYSSYTCNEESEQQDEPP
jgi:hypothetical protein